MELSNGELWAAHRPLQELLAEKWPGKKAYWLARLASIITKHYNIVEPLRTKLVEEHGEVGPNKVKMVVPGTDNWTAFMADYEELMGIIVEVDFAPIVLPIELPVTPEQEFRGSTWAALLSFVEPVETEAVNGKSASVVPEEKAAVNA